MPIIALLCASVLIAPTVAAKEGVEASLHTDIASIAAEGSSIDLSWSLSDIKHNTPFNACEVFVRLTGPGGASTETFAGCGEVGGHYSVTAIVPDGGIAKLEIGVAGTMTSRDGKSSRADWIIPLAKRPDASDLDAHALREFAIAYAAAWSHQDPVAFASFYAENGSLAINDGAPSVGRDAIAQTARDFMQAFPDMVVRLVNVRRDDEHVIFEWHWTGTNSGPGGTGNAVDLQGYEQWILAADGRILQSLGHMDEIEYQRQLHSVAQ